jgi:hypothetical protein
MSQYAIAAPKQFLDSDLFHRLLMIPVEFGVETSGIGKVSLLSFHPYRERQNLSLYAFCASI